MTKLGVVVIGTEKYRAHCGPLLARQDDVRLVSAWRLARNFGADANLLDTDLPCGIAITGSEEPFFSPRPDCAVMALSPRDPIEAQQVNQHWHIRLLELGIDVMSASDGLLVFPPSRADQAYVSRRDAVGIRAG